MVSGLPGLKFQGKKIKPFLLLAALILAGFIGWILYDHFHAKPTAPSTGIILTPSQAISAQTSTAQKALTIKDYQQAVDSYAGASSNAFNAKDYAQAKSILQECITKVPDQYVTWDIYESLAVTARALKDTTLEKSSLQMALKKASAPNSGATAGDITLIQQTLQAIK